MIKEFYRYSADFFNFLHDNIAGDPAALRLKYAGKNLPFPVGEAIDQIECRRKTRKKLPFFNSCRSFLYPAVQASEQATNQYVASYHAMLAGAAEDEGRRILDMTAGLGIDAFTMALAGAQITAIELDSHRAKILSLNAEALNLPSLNAICGDSVAMLESYAGTPFDTIFIDPARRDSANRRTYFLEDSLPDVTLHAPMMLRHARRVIIKASPILDITRAIGQLPDVAEIHAVCLRGECKEVLIILDRGSGKLSEEHSRGIKMVAVDLKGDDEDEYPYRNPRMASRFEFTSRQGSRKSLFATDDDIRDAEYIYNPNAGVHKLNCSAELCEKFPAIRQISPNTELYISQKPVADFPGTAFRIAERPDRKQLKRLKKESYAVITRNYTMTADELRRKLGVSESDSRFIIGCRAGMKANPEIFICEKL